MVLDVMAPPYNEGRACTYFREFEWQTDLSSYPKARKAKKSRQDRKEHVNTAETRCWLLEDPQLDFTCVTSDVEADYVDKTFLESVFASFNRPAPAVSPPSPKEDVR